MAMALGSLNSRFNDDSNGAGDTAGNGHDEMRELWRQLSAKKRGTHQITADLERVFADANPYVQAMPPNNGRANFYAPSGPRAHSMVSTTVPQESLESTSSGLPDSIQQEGSYGDTSRMDYFQQTQEDRSKKSSKRPPRSRRLVGKRIALMICEAQTDEDVKKAEALLHSETEDDDPLYSYIMNVLESMRADRPFCT